MDYRREIDGLRAIAVSAVVLYHFWPNLFKNGYLGVDVFFVISGFLITLYIYEASLLKKFSFRTFYERRIRRILPVTLLVLFATLSVASFILIGVDYERFVESLLASLTFTSNIYFWRDGGYFGQADSLKPLLHIWSLSVEEQFYLLFPLFFVLIVKSSKSSNVHLFLLVILSLISLGVCLYMLQIGGDNPAFFLTPFRAWEFGFGSIAALFFFKYKRQHSTLSIWLSIVLVAVGLSALSKFIAPGFLATLGTALFLSMTYRSTVVLNLFFESGVVRYLGLISFSTYLWHWPLVVFLGYVTIGQPDPYSLISVLFLTYFLSVLSYKFIEQPFRKSVNPRIVVFGCFFITLTLLVVAFVTLRFDLFKNKGELAEKVAASIQTNYRCSVSEYRSYGESRACLINSNAEKNYSVSLVGNSHAQMYVPAIESHLRARNEKALLVPLNGCLPTVRANISVECMRLAKINLEAILNDANVSTVILGMTWYSDTLVDSSSAIIKDDDKSQLLLAIKDLIVRLEGGEKRVFLIGPLMIPGYDLPSVLSRRIKFEGLDYKSVEAHLRVGSSEFDSQFSGILAELKALLGDRLILPSSKFCDLKNCYLGDFDGVYFSDSNHLGSYGVTKVEELFEVIFANQR
jgi:peptidoglycan/LPS O-acetylase OafA/YrhL